MNKKKGFTLIELTLSIAFIGILLIGIASLVLHMSNMYQKGLALRGVNYSGQQIVEDIERTLNGASFIIDIAKVDTNSDGYVDDDESKASLWRYFYESTYPDGTQKYGALCLADYTYIWNTAPTLKRGAGVTIRGVRYRMARIPDPLHRQCDLEYTDTVTVANSGGVEDVNIDPPMATDPVELIESDEIDLALYDFSIMPAIQSVTTKQAFLNATFILATLKGGVNILANSDYCQGSDVSEYNNYDFNYCAVNKFNFSVRTGGSANSREG